MRRTSVRAVGRPRHSRTASAVPSRAINPIHCIIATCLILLALNNFLQQSVFDGPTSGKVQDGQFLSGHAEWRPRDVNRYKSIRRSNAAENQKYQEIDTQSANRVPPKLAEIDLGNDEANRINGNLRRAGITVDADLEVKLPKWGEMTAIYGAQPVILGLDRCETFRANLKKNTDAMIGPAGLFNTGLNLFEQSLYLNCDIPGSSTPKKGKEHDAPWGKHTPASLRRHFDASAYEGVSHTDTLAVAVVKDPYSWMRSMCNRPYLASWAHSKSHCPNLVERTGGYPSPNNVRVSYNENMKTQHESLVALWNDWYGSYYAATWPRLLIRYEDLLFYPEYIITKVCQCAGGKIVHENFQFNSRRSQEDSSGMVNAILKYGHDGNRAVGFTDDDLSFSNANLRRDLMGAFNYTHPIDIRT